MSRNDSSIMDAVVLSLLLPVLGRHIGYTDGLTVWGRIPFSSQAVFRKSHESIYACFPSFEKI